jgi:monofunctional glycosyltransferase
MPAKRQSGVTRIVAVILKIGVTLVALSLVWAGTYRFINPPTTYLMLRDWHAGLEIRHRWQPLNRIAKAAPLAAIAAEDARFCSHHGFDVEAIEQALKANELARERGKSRIRGGSTISQQTAKNVFLWPKRSWVRKGLEAYFTVVIELLWPKRRIMEIYLNVAEWGPGIYGIEAASKHYFKKSASRLTKKEAARLVSILPSPLKWSPTDPSKRVKRKARNVRRALTTVEAEAASCLKP